MVHPILTLWGMVQYRPEILTNIELPDGMDADAMRNYIFMYAGDNECRYGNAEMLDMLVHSWFSSRKHDFQYMWDAMNAEYNPIENYDRQEDFTTTTVENEKGTKQDNTQRNENTDVAQQQDANTDITPGRVSETTTSAFNSTDYQPSSKTTESGSEKSVSASEGKGTQNTNENINSTGDHNTDRNENVHNVGRAHGNIGVTTNQQMIESELVLRQKNAYKMIALEFEDEFTITVYGRRCYHGLL